MTTPTAPHVVLRDVTRVHGSGETAVTALAGVSLDVHPGELVAVMGPSGSGKSTLLNVAGGLDRPTSGSVVVGGEDLTGLSPRDLARMRRRRMGFVFQDFNLIPSLTAAENVALPLELDGMRARRARRQARHTLDLMDLMSLSDRYPDQMSGGQQQRVAIARALVGSRRFVLADEPTGALDSHTGEEVLRVLRERCDAGVAGLLVTHEARHAAWADRVVFLRDGEVVDSTGGSDRAEDLLATVGAVSTIAPPRPDTDEGRSGASTSADPGRFAQWRSSWTVALRMARRDVRRHRGRSALVVVMVLLPTLLLSTVVTLAFTSEVKRRREGTGGDGHRPGAPRGPRPQRRRPGRGPHAGLRLPE